MRRAFLCFILVSFLSSCMQLRPYSYFTFGSSTPSHVRAMIADRVVKLAEANGANCKVLSKDERRTACDFSGKNFSVDLIVTNPESGVLEVLITDEIGFWFPPKEESVQTGSYLSTFYVDLERSIAAIIPENTQFIARRGYTGSGEQEIDIPLRYE